MYSDEHTVVVILLIKFRNGTNRSPRFPLFLRRFKGGCKETGGGEKREVGCVRAWLVWLCTV